jgi:nucleobase:cation symporter-1, NCS1 family
MQVQEEAARFEQHTIRPIPQDERHGTPRDLFTIWTGTNIMLLTVVTGALSVTVFGQPFWWAVGGLVLGNLVGAIFMALHSAQGPQLGVPQMVQTRGQFGSMGALLVVGIVVLMYIGFFASIIVLGGQSIHSLIPGIGTNTALVIIGILSLCAAIWGYDLIHAYTRIITYCSTAILLLAFVWIICVHGLPGGMFHKNTMTLAGLIGTTSTAALWQIAYAPYVSDYSRYLPVSTDTSTAFWATYGGTVLGSIFPMVLGALIGLAVSNGDVIGGLTALTGTIAPVVVIALAGGIASAAAMNLYCCTLSTITIGQTAFPRWSPKAAGRVVISIILFMIAMYLSIVEQNNFLVAYTNFLLALLYVLVPWTAINLVDYYIIRHGDYDVTAFFRQDGGIYGRFAWVAIFSYFLGALVQLPFMATDFYTGPIAQRLGGADISWIIGLILTSLVYYWGTRVFRGRSSQFVEAD